MKDVDCLMRQAVEKRVFPGGVLLVYKDREIEFFEAYGQADLFTGAVMTRNTLFDLASLTKPLATTLAVMSLVQDSKLNLEQTVASVLPDFLDPGVSCVTVRHLLAHSSGLPAYRPYYIRLMQIPSIQRPEYLKRMLTNECLRTLPDSGGVYSDIGFMILRWIVETITGKRLDHFLYETIYRPLGLKHLLFFEANQMPDTDDIAATELCPWRRQLLKGRVHDDNAFAVGGIDGHAGLFGTAADVGSLLSLLLSAYRGQPADSEWISPELIRCFWSRHEPSKRALGFDMPSPVGASCGCYFPETAVGHLGYTGTSFWIDVEHAVIVILLTNRVHPSRWNVEIRRFRPLVHNQIMQDMKLTTS